MKNRTTFNWECSHCSKRNLDKVRFQFKVPQNYSVDWQCSKCGKMTMVTFAFGIKHARRKAG